MNRSLATPVGVDGRSNDLRRFVEYLCSDACLPRLPGTPGGLAAQRFVEQSFKDVGIEPAGENGYLQAIPEIGGSNVIGMIPGASPRTIIIGAHFDACAIDGGINPGASDNAASVAAMVEVAKELVASDELARTVVFIGFDAEEPPFFQQHTMGSLHFVANPTIDLDHVDLMVCLDMIGHPTGSGRLADTAKSLVTFGSETSPEVSAALERMAPVDSLNVHRMDTALISQMSDFAGFQNAGIPFLFYSALRHEHYHATTDTPDTLDYDKIESLVTHLTTLLLAIDSEPLDPFTYLPDGRDDVESVATTRFLLRLLPPSSRYAASAPGLLDGLADRAPDGLTESDRKLLRRLFSVIEDSLQDSECGERTRGR